MNPIRCSWEQIFFAPTTGASPAPLLCHCHPEYQYSENWWRIDYASSYVQFRFLRSSAQPALNDYKERNTGRPVNC